MTATLIIDGTTIYQTQIDENYTKILSTITPPSSSANRGDAEPKSTILIDLRRIERRLTVNGFIDASDRTALRTTFKSQGNVTLSYDGESITGIAEKLEIRDTALDKESSTPGGNITSQYYDVQFTFVAGDSLG